MELITQAEFARRINVSRVRVTYLKGKGRLVMVGNKVDYEKSLILAKPDTPIKPDLVIMEEATKKKQGKEPTENELRVQGIKAQVLLTEHKASNEGLKFDKDSSVLINRADVEQEFFELARIVRDGLNTIPPKIAPVICSNLGVPIKKAFDIEQLISSAIREVLEEFERLPDSIKPKKSDNV